MTSATADGETRALMCPDNLRTGMTLGPIFYVVSSDQIEKFATATRANPCFVKEGIAPPTMRLQDYALLIAKHFHGGSGGVHAKHWSEFYAPMRAGQAVKSAGRITHTERKRGKFYFDLEYETRDAATDQLLVRQAITAVLLVEGKIS